MTAPATYSRGMGREEPAAGRGAVRAPRIRPLDVAVGTGAITFLTTVTSHIPPEANDRAVDAFGLLTLAVAGAAMGITRGWPRTALVLVAAALAGYVARHYPNGPMYIVGWVALLSLSRRTDRRTALAGAAVLSAAVVTAGMLIRTTTPWLPFIVVGWSAAAVFLGDALRNRRSYLAELEERARFLERTREEEARRRVAEDRLRIARDLHDSVAHAMTAITVQAGAAAHVMDRNPQAVRDALSAIQRASGDVLDELAAMLSLLREDGERADRAPAPGLDQVGQLVEAAREAGQPVSLDVAGSTADVPAHLGTAAYRIVQESLTNVIRHARATSATVVVRAGPGRRLTVRVGDNGTGSRPDPTSAGTGAGTGTGTGIRGMRERAESSGGRLEAGPAPGGGFLVSAVWEDGS